MTGLSCWSWWLRGSLLGSMVIVLLLVALSYWSFGSPSYSLAYIGGQRVAASPSVYDLGTGREGETRRAVFNVRNLGARPVVITGMQTSCTCITAGSFPISLDPGTAEDIAFSVRFSAEGTALSQPIILYTDLSEQQALTLRVEGRLLPSRRH
jgi:Protein of unknown function (DUF1573)